MNSERITRVLVVGGDAAMVRGFSAMLDDAPDMEVIAEVGACDEAVAAARELHPDVALVLVDSMVGGTDGMGTVQAIARVRPWMRAVVITGNVVRNLVPAVKAGAAGILSAESSRAELLTAVRRIHEVAFYSAAVG